MTVFYKQTLPRAQRSGPHSQLVTRMIGLLAGWSVAALWLLGGRQIETNFRLIGPHYEKRLRNS